MISFEVEQIRVPIKINSNPIVKNAKKLRNNQGSVPCNFCLKTVLCGSTIVFFICSHSLQAYHFRYEMYELIIIIILFSNAGYNIGSQRG